MPKCTVVFEDDLDEMEIQLLSQAIQRFRGVKWVERDHSSSPSQSMYGGMPREDHMEIPSEFQMPRRPQPQQQPPQQPAASVNSQRHFIDKAIRWGIQNQKVSIEEIKNLSAEAIVQLALKLIDAMPESEKRQLGEEMSMM